ncbi:hypothetical protein PoB_006711700 [Plakobranchus ocellatus]|uniref:Uncharacterized protein n=1 Tax=Plakobranchus ocellatus TaxID=259542 RepID=A0AAV4D950_9GAST|nr:hypothetical protein PoB_006711700 [Plakobranchus ocellatus]
MFNSHPEASSGQRSERRYLVSSSEMVDSVKYSRGRTIDDWNLINATVQIKVFSKLDGARIVCFGGLFNGTQLSNLDQLVDVYSKPMQFYYVPGTPTLKIKFHKPFTGIAVGKFLKASCASMVRPNHTIIWELATPSQVYIWDERRKEKNYLLPKWAHIADKTVVLQEQLLAHSDLELKVHSGLQNGHLQCRSESKKYFVNPVNKRRILTESLRSPAFKVFFLAGAPQVDNKIIVDQKTNRTLVERNCSVNVGTGGFLTWIMPLNDGKTYKWRVDTKGNISGTTPPFLTRNDGLNGRALLT